MKPFREISPAVALTTVMAIGASSLACGGEPSRYPDGRSECPKAGRIPTEGTVDQWEKLKAECPIADELRGCLEKVLSMTSLQQEIRNIVEPEAGDSKHWSFAASLPALPECPDGSYGDPSVYSSVNEDETIIGLYYPPPPPRP